VTAPTRKRTKNTAVTGTSRLFVGTPPSIAASGENGPTLGWVRSTVTRVLLEVGDDNSANALPVADTRATPPDCDINVELSAFPEVVADREPGAVMACSTEDDDPIIEVKFDDSLVDSCNDEVSMTDEEVSIGAAEAAGVGVGVGVMITEEIDCDGRKEDV
jgi:hypothetical protein